MNLSILDELQPIAEELQRHMSSHVLEHLAKEKGFITRKSVIISVFGNKCMNNTQNYMYLGCTPLLGKISYKAFIILIRYCLGFETNKKV
ncbi:hypothetical protein CN434_02140 [Bacillus thuringiensis]|nr:hypothetical protein CN434_02140 [Bacillus thuringiensis]